MSNTMQIPVSSIEPRLIKPDYYGPVKKLKIPHRINDDGQIIVNIKDLKPNKLNSVIYGNLKDEFSKVKEITNDMKERMSQGEEVPNHTPAPIDQYGNMAGGHTRAKAALEAGYTEMSITLLSYKQFNVNMDDYDNLMETTSQNGFARNNVPSIILNAFNGFEQAYLKKYKQNPPKETIDNWIVILNSKSAVPISKNFIDNLKIVKERNPSLLDDIDKGKLTVGQAYNKAKNTRPPKPVNPNRPNFFEILKKDPLVQKYAVYNFIKSVKHILSSTMKTRNGTEIEDTFDETIGSEKHLTSTAISNKLMSAFALAFKDAGFVVQTPIDKMGDPDIRFPEDSLPQFDMVKIEAKSSETRSKGIRIYAGERATQLKPTEHTISVWSDNFKKLALFFVTMTGDDWNKSDERSKDCFTTIEQVYKNHTPGVDFISLVGDVQVINGVPQIVYADTDEVFEKLKNKIN